MYVERLIVDRIAELWAEAHALGFRRGLGSRKRPIKGLVDAVISEELAKMPGMTTDELERRMRGVASLANIRNRLSLGKKQGRYRREGWRWFVVEGPNGADSD